ncbi:Nif3-like dinuclear metal center hexameric protein [Limosilactobacillus fastidiosus]|uniref:GTP cyclohydrolase 1 type 2 homolog n=1 Tax=Limosilactobacillus fastidiosus TaxID=2759855 RepID=A0ABR6E6E6_9LACO|nr:Nif3-like dinuclear metal center hexameric protein [Limosilactobacillus fastidiosus]MBB1062773.1 Nif3-like dinuclear metal center hexameric protein [Limosilactobacillus fastidiosus]MCD7084814.1 Nif3-like dinuclear metal center hexameric protein [Limosilactobacillus fastidiosus]
MTTGNELIHRFEQYASPKLAENWDNPGLQLGNPDKTIKRVMTTLDVRPEVVREAVEQDVDFIFAHHPVMFHPAKKLDTRMPQNEMYVQLLSHGITVYAAHTNLDTANGGMNDWLASQLRLTNTERLIDSGLDPVSRKKVGMGRIGTLNGSMNAREFAQYCMRIFGVKGLRWLAASSDMDKPIHRVAVLGGAGQDFWHVAVDKGADAYVTGDVTYHFAHDMVANHLTVIDPGHHIEAICESQLAELFGKWKKENNWDFEIIQNRINTDPFNFMLNNEGEN